MIIYKLKKAWSRIVNMFSYKTDRYGSYYHTGYYVYVATATTCSSLMDQKVLTIGVSNDVETKLSKQVPLWTYTTSGFKVPVDKRKEARLLAERVRRVVRKDKVMFYTIFKSSKDWYGDDNMDKILRVLRTRTLLAIDLDKIEELRLRR